MSTVDLILRLLVAALFGAAIGFEREMRGKPAGLRTNALITLGAALFTVVSVTIGGDDGSTDRVAAQIVTGIGFLGAGAIIQSGRSVHGMTTAATIWVNAAVGMAAGAGEFAIAAGATAISVVVLAVLVPIERRLTRRVPSDKSDDQ
jgi:putative Mg2+ transporter-C (MgtC) family protein